LDRLFDNSGIGNDKRPGTANLDGAGRSLSAHDLAAAGWGPGSTLDIDGARLRWPTTAPGRPDNVRAAGQSVRLTGRGDAVAFLVAGTGRRASGTGDVRYRDGSHTRFTLIAPNWRTGPRSTKPLALAHITTRSGPSPDPRGCTW